MNKIIKLGQGRTIEILLIRKSSNLVRTMRKFTEAQLEKVLIELLGQEGFPTIWALR